MSLFTRIKDLVLKTALDTDYYIEVDKSGQSSTEKMLLTDLKNPAAFVGGGFIEKTGNQTIQTNGAIYCRDDTDTINISIADAWAKDVSFPFSVGNGSTKGTLDTGTVAAFSLYQLYLISTAAGVSDILTVIGGGTPTLPSGYSYKKEIARIILDRSGNIAKIYQSNQFANFDGIATDILPKDYCTGLNIKKSGSSIDFQIGATKDDTNTIDLNYDSTALEIRKSLGAVWSAGENGGILDAGSIADDTFYYVYIIANTSNGLIDFIMSPSVSPTLPTGYDYKKVIDYLLTFDYSVSTSYSVWKCDELTDLYKIIEKDDDFDFEISGDIKKTIIFTGTSEKTMNLPASSTIEDDSLLRAYYISNNSDYDLKIWINGGAENFLIGMKYLYLSPNKKIQIGGSYDGWDLITNCDVSAMVSISSAWASTNFSTLTTVPIDTIDIEQNDSVLEVNIYSHFRVKVLDILLSRRS